MKRILCLIMSLLLLWSCAAAEWTCPDPACGRTWDDAETLCDECGAEAPLHGLNVMLVGDDFLRVQWYGYMAEEVDLYCRAVGSGSWRMCGTTGKRSANISGLDQGTAYEVMLVDWNGSQLTVTGTTNVEGAPAEDLSARVAELETTVAEQQVTIEEQSAALAASAASTIIDASTSTLVIHYVDVNTRLDVAGSVIYVGLMDGTYTVSALPQNLPEDYVLVGDGTAEVKVAYGRVIPAEVFFTYTRAAAGTTVTHDAVGKYATFGHYPQTASGRDRTSIQWLVLAVDGDKALVISRYALDARCYQAGDTYPTWEKSEIRTWLNSTFLNKAFTAAEQASIVTTTVSTPAYNGIRGGANTQDKVWLLSRGEVSTYIQSDESRHTVPTEYAAAQGAWQYSGADSTRKLDGTGCCWWWLRSPGTYSSSASGISAGGSLGGSSVDKGTNAVRPALWVKLDALVFN